MNEFPRRGFVKSVAAGAAALVAGKWSTAGAQPAERSGAHPEQADWVKRIHGKHRQVIDATMPNGGFQPAFALNFIGAYIQMGVPASEMTSVISYRHFAMPLLLNDSIWAKYPIADIIGVMDPKTNAPARRNIFRDAIALHPGLTYEQVLSGEATKATVILTACDVALHILAGMSAAKIGNISAAAAAEEWKAGLLKNVVLVPSGVYAINAAQEAGCKYCFGG